MRVALTGNRLVLALALLVVWFVIAMEAVFLLVWADPPAIAWVGLAIPLIVALGFSIGGYVLLRNERPSHGLSADERAHAGGGAYRVLVVSNETASDDALRQEIARKSADRPTEVLIVAPVLVGPVEHWTDDEDAARRAAGRRLDDSRAALAGIGVDTRTELGSDDPLRAVEDALRTFAADEIIVFTHPAGKSNWLELGVVEQLREFYDIPVGHVVVDRDPLAERRGPPKAQAPEQTAPVA